MVKLLSLPSSLQFFARTNLRTFSSRTSICVNLGENYYRNFDLFSLVRENLSVLNFQISIWQTAMRQTSFSQKLPRQ